MTASAASDAYHLRSWLLGLDHLWRIRHDPLRFYQQLQSRHADAVSVTLGTRQCWFLFHPAHVETVLGKQASHFIRFERIMKVLKQWNGTSLLMEEGLSWKERRRKVLPVFRQQKMPEYAGLAAEFALRYRSQRLAALQRGAMPLSCDIDTEMARYSLEVGGSVMFGKDFLAHAEKFDGYVSSLSAIAYDEVTSVLPLPLTLRARRAKHETVTGIRALVKTIVAERIAKRSAADADALAILIEHHAGNHQVVEDDVMSLLIAGHETSGSTLSWLFLLLARHQHVLAELQQELDEVLQGKVAGFDDLRRLPRLVAAVEETMRLYPAAYALFCREATTDVTLSESLTIRRGELVQILPFVTQRDSRWFDEADNFLPSRFLNTAEWPRYAYFPFGGGERICIGQSLGLVEVVITAATLLQQLCPCAIDTMPRAIAQFSLRPEGGAGFAWRRRD